MVSRVGAVAAFLAILAGRLAAQEATGLVEGWAVTPEAQPAASVRVTASGPNLQGRRSVETDTRGYFRLIGLPVGAYQVRLALIGYRPVVFTDVIVRLGGTTSLGELHLESQALELGEIVVTAERGLLDLTSAASVTNPAPDERDPRPDDGFRGGALSGAGHRSPSITGNPAFLTSSPNLGSERRLSISQIHRMCRSHKGSVSATW